MQFWIMIIVGECSSGGDSEFDDDCMQLVIPGTHVVNDSDSDEQRIATHVDEERLSLSSCIAHVFLVIAFICFSDLH
jgi:hypothetical protein